MDDALRSVVVRMYTTNETEAISILNTEYPNYTLEIDGQYKGHIRNAFGNTVIIVNPILQKDNKWKIPKTTY